MVSELQGVSLSDLAVRCHFHNTLFGKLAKNKQKNPPKNLCEATHKMQTLLSCEPSKKKKKKIVTAFRDKQLKHYVK